MSIVSTPSFSTVHPSLGVTLMLNVRISLFESHKRLMRNYKERTLCLGARGTVGRVSSLFERTMLDVCLLGTGGTIPLPRRRLSATLVRVGGGLVLLDCGEGTQVALRN